jgi:putative endonuclease
LAERIKRFARMSASPDSMWRRAGLQGRHARRPPTVTTSAPLSRREVGATGEKTAESFLKRRGYKILERNVRSRYGEIDIIAREDRCLVFVEVRTRRGSEFGTPEESVTSAKRGRLVALAESYLQSLEKMPSSWRIDLVAVELDREGRTSTVRHIENVVEGGCWRESWADRASA